MGRGGDEAELQARREDTMRAATARGVDTRGLSERLLPAVVAHVTGRDDLPPRPGQLALMRAIDASGEGGHVVASAPTGTGKTFAVLVPALVGALDGERTVLSTEMRSLQTQVMHKDAPAVLDVLEGMTGVRPKVALHQGWHNYVCLKSCVDQAVTLLAPMLADGLPSGEAKALQWATGLLPSVPGPGEVALVPLLRWALSTESQGDRNACEVDFTESDWEKVSVSSGDCIGADCPFVDRCFPRAARRRAAVADVVVTNHSLLGIQAARNVPVVVGSRTLGPFDRVVVDECHSLPGIVRSQGASLVSANRLRALQGLRERLLLTGSDLTRERRLAEDLARTLSSELDRVVVAARRSARTGRGGAFGDREVLRLGEDDPLEGCGDEVEEWCRRVRSEAEGAASGMLPSNPAKIKVLRLANRAESLGQAVTTVRRHAVGVARWVQLSDGQVTLESSPVDVGGALHGNLWTAPAPSGDDGDDGVQELGEGDDPVEAEARIPLKVVALSATVPSSFCMEAGLRGPVLKVDSPFEAAYAASAAHVPDLSPKEWDQVCVTSSDGRRRFDTGRHREWAQGRIVDLVDANAGHALVLSATAANGRAYAEALRNSAGGRWRVLSQWDGAPMRSLVESWRADPSAVLVGTRSLMTGVDAPGATCSLVVVDRVPRSAGNPVDDARVEAVMERMQLGRWQADTLVYVSDAAQLAQQAAGRLIRRESDRGMVAVLEPRLHKGSKMSYSDEPRRAYMAGLRPFGTKLKRHEDALAWLRTAAHARSSASAA